VAGKPDYYGVLGVDRGASQDEIKKTYKRLARQYHPDVNPEPEAEEKFKDLSEAYTVLGDPDRRARYDRFGHEGLQADWTGAGGFGIARDLEDLIATFFGGGFGRQEVERGADLRYDLEIELKDVLKGASHKVSVKKLEYCEACNGTGAAGDSTYGPCQQCGGAGRLVRNQTTFFGTFSSTTTCPTCRGSGRVPGNPCRACGAEGRSVEDVTLSIEVPAGVEDGSRLRLRGQGEAGRRGAPPGDLYVVVHVREDARFERRGTELATEVPLTFAQAALGQTLHVDGLNGETAQIEIPAGTQAGEHFRARGMGVPSLRDPRRRGDMHVFVRVTTPTDLTDEEKELLRRLAELRGERDNGGAAQPKGFFRKVMDHLMGE